MAALGDVEAAVITLGDQPFITPQVIAGVLDHRGRHLAVRATYDGAPGHPVLLERRLLDHVSELEGDAGARELLERRTCTRGRPGGCATRPTSTRRSGSRRSSHEARAVLRGRRADRPGVGRAQRPRARRARASPGAAITDHDEDGTYHGTFQVKLGPTTAAYRGTIKIESADESTHTATLKARGTDKRGQGGASATIVNTLSEHDGGTTRRRRSPTSRSPAAWRASAAAA